MGWKRYFFGNSREKMPAIAFKIMAAGFCLMDCFRSPAKRLNDFGIEEGFTIIDYGCGPGRYLKQASQLVGEKGRVYAVDIHRLAIESVKRKIERFNLKNVQSILADGYFCPLDEHRADMIYVLDTFHMIEKPDLFFRELHRLLKKEGFLIIDAGHQSRNQAKTKINKAKLWDIVEEKKGYLRCRPVNN